MARPRTKSSPIQLRIELDMYERLAGRAAGAGQTVAEYVATLIDKHLGPAPGARPANAPCDHPRAKVTLIGGGLARCACGSIRGMNGQWTR